MEDVLLVDDSVAFNDDAPIESDPDGISTSGTGAPSSDTTSIAPGGGGQGFEELEPIEEEEDDIDFDDSDPNEIFEEDEDE
jgi:hypothetical protein